jgi:hypothetical protein
MEKQQTNPHTHFTLLLSGSFVFIVCIVKTIHTDL